MIVVDSGVWIDFFRGAESVAKVSLKKLLAGNQAEIVVPDLVLYEVLRGFRHRRDLERASQLMLRFDVPAAFDPRLALIAAEHCRSMVAKGFTIRSALDVMIGAFCIDRGYALLHNDRDFDTMHELRGLKVYA